MSIGLKGRNILPMALGSTDRSCKDLVAKLQRVARPLCNANLEVPARKAGPLDQQRVLIDEHNHRKSLNAP
jgi:hypothetical protein